MKRIIYLLLIISFFTSCEDLTTLNDDPKRSPVAPAGSLFASAEKALMDNLTSPNVNLNIFRLLTQQWTQTTYTDESNFDLSTRTIPDGWWQAIYRDVIQDLHEAKRIAESDPDITAETLKNQLAMAEILEVYAWAILVDTFGDIPYSKAFLIDENLTPGYDDSATIYGNLITRINTALSDLDVAEESWGESDLFYGGDVTHWLKLGNSIKLRLGMMLADVDGGTLARQTVEAAAPNVFDSNEDNAIFYYKSAPPNTNPVWVNLVQSGRKDFVAANTFVDAMVALNDPRVPVYFTTDASGSSYTGGIFGASNGYATYSKPGDLVDNSDFPASLMDYSEVEFFLAEAAERGWTVGGTAEQHYEMAIEASMTAWGVSDSEIATYLGQASVAYATAEGGDSMKAIAMQKWIALYNRGFEAWTEWRRFDYPVLVAPTDAVSDTPLRFTYPVSEQNLNSKNYDLAAEAMGGDDVASQIFWDVN